MEENNTEIEEVEETEEVEEKLQTVKKTFWDYNLSWVLLIALAVACILIGQSNIRTLASEGVAIGNNVVYILLEVLFSLAIGTVFYSIGKIVGGALCGYRLLFIKVFGFKFGFPEGKFKFTKPASIGAILDFRLIMTPKNKSAKPTLMLLGGPIATIILQGALVGISLVTKSDVFFLSTLFACGYVACVIIYQWFPIRTDNFNDGFTFLKARSDKNRLAYNLFFINKAKDEAHLPLEIEEFDSYKTFMAANYEYYVYLNYLYQDKLEQAVTHLNNCVYYLPYMSYETSIKIKAERIFLLIIADNLEEADKTFRYYSHDDRVVIEKAYELVSFRTALLVAGTIETEFNRAKDIVHRFHILTQTLTRNPRVEKELYLFDLAVTKVKDTHKDWDFDAVVEDIKEDKLKPTEIEDDDEDEEDED